jgi:hypothetical protein
VLSKKGRAKPVLFWRRAPGKTDWRSAQNELVLRQKISKKSLAKPEKERRKVKPYFAPIRMQKIAGYASQFFGGKRQQNFVSSCEPKSGSGMNISHEETRTANTA